MRREDLKNMISAIILCKNEEKNIAKCVESVSFCDEIIIIDDYSTDKTTELIKNLKNPKISIIYHALNNDFSQARNYGLSKARGEWVLFIDADERVSPALAYEISNVIHLSDEDRAFYIRRQDVMWEKKLEHGEVGNVRLLRLARRDIGKWEGKVHEEWRVKGRVRQLKNPLLHYPHETSTEFLQKINFYTSLRAKELYAKGKKTNLMEIILYPLGKFLVNYFLRLGFLDGTAGFVYAVFMSFHSFLVRAKLWQKK